MRAVAMMFALAALSTGGVAMAEGQAQNADRSGEIGYARGALGYDALVAGDIRTAEIQLETASNVAANDPARLINLGYVHMRSGRLATAQSLFEAARDSDTSFAVELADGSVADSRDVARRALTRVSQAMASR
jgi:Tfp pilus assembly protein PilF